MKGQQILWGVLVLSSFLLTNCKSTTEETVQENKVEQGWEEVMAVHDVIMPLTMKLPPLWEDLDTLKDVVEDSDKVEAIKAQISDLQSAHKAMYDWMEEANAIKASLDKKKEDAALKQLLAEQARIDQVKKDTDTAYEEATKLLETLKEK